jgi:hypothetical protein
MRTCLSLISFLFFNCFLYSQEENSYNHQLISGISKYRSALLQKNSSLRNIFGIIISETEKMDDDAKKKLSEFDYYSYEEGPEFESEYHAYLRELYGDSSILSQSKIDMPNVIYQNYDLIDCINLDILEPRYPFKIKQSSQFFKEFEAYQIQSNERVLVMGDSKFTLAMLTGIIFNSLHVLIGYRTDFNSGSDLSRITKSYLDSSNLVQSFKFNADDFPLENLNVDRIIMRSLSDHVSIKKPFIESLKKNMNKFGKLIIVVQDPFLIKEKRRLKNEVSMQEQLFNNLSRSGFTMEENIKLDPFILYRFQIRGN